MIKRNLIFIITSIVIAGLNIYGWQITLKLDTRLAWIALALIFLNLILAWLTWRRNRYISYLFVTSSLIVELIIFNNYFWLQKIGRTP